MVASTTSSVSCGAPSSRALDHAANLGELLHQVRLGVEPAGGVDDRDVVAARPGRLDGVVGDGGGIGAVRGADEVGLRPLRPDLELLLGGSTERVGGPEEDTAVVLAELLGELADRRRLAGAVDPDDEDHARLRGDVQGRGLAEQVGDLLRERLAEVAELAAGLQAADQLRSRPDPDVTADQRLLEPLPVLLVARVEGRGGELARERAPALAERVAQAPEEALALLRALLRPLGVAEQLCPRSGHRGRVAPWNDRACVATTQAHVLPLRCSPESSLCCCNTKSLAPGGLWTGDCRVRRSLRPRCRAGGGGRRPG